MRDLKLMLIWQTTATLNGLALLDLSRQGETSIVNTLALGTSVILMFLIALKGDT